MKNLFTKLLKIIKVLIPWLKDTWEEYKALKRELKRD